MRFLHSLFFGIVLAIFFTGCNAPKSDYKAVVESDTSWSGSFGNKKVEGSGNAVIDLPNDIFGKVATVRKKTEHGYLHIQIEPSGEPEETTEAYGVVTATA